MRRRPLRYALLLAGLVAVAAAGWLGTRELAARRHWQAAQDACRRHDFDAARPHLDACLEAWPKRADVLLLATRAARLAERFGEAEERLSAYRERHGESDAFALEWRLLRTQQADLSGNEEYLVERVRQDPAGAAPILEVLTPSYARAHRLPEALHCAEELLKRDPEHVEGLVWRGWAKEHLERFDEAVDDYRKAVALRPGDAWARLSLGEVLLHLNKPGEALEHFVYLAEHPRPDNTAVLLGLARCRRAVGQVEEARALLDELLAAAPDEPLVLRERGALALDEDRVAEAERLLERSVRLLPRDRQARYALGQCYQKLGRGDLARQQLEWVERLDHDQKRLAALTRQIVQRPHAPDKRCEAGLICLRLDKETEGVRWLLSAVRQDPLLVPAHEALADHYAHAGQAQLAVRHRQLAEQGRARTTTPAS